MAEDEELHNRGALASLALLQGWLLGFITVGACAGVVLESLAAIHPSVGGTQHAYAMWPRNSACCQLTAGGLCSHGKGNSKPYAALQTHFILREY